MTRLTLAGCSKDGSRLLLVSDDGAEFSLAVDDRLRAALRGDPARTWAQTGQLEIQMESMLRPRDIQARIRAGASPEEVAAAAQTTVDQIMPYAGPVLAERAHIADRAQRSSLRRTHELREPGPRTLRDAVAAVLRPHNVDPDRVEWDAWRREDGRWQLTAAFASDERTGLAEFHFDMPGNFVLPANGDASWLVGDTPSVAPSRPAVVTTPLPRARHLGVVETDQEPEVNRRTESAPVGQDALDLVESARKDAREQSWETEMPLDAFFADESPEDPQPAPDGDETSVDPDADTSVTDAVNEETTIREEPPARREVRKSRGRASVPSWDEIMFGGGPSD